MEKWQVWVIFCADRLYINFVKIVLCSFVYQLAMQWQNMLEESFTQHLDTLKSCSSQQQSSTKVRSVKCARCEFYANFILIQVEVRVL